MYSNLNVFRAVKFQNTPFNRREAIVGTAVCGVHANNFRTYMHVVTLTLRFLLKLFYLCQYFKLQSGFLYLYEKANQTFPL